MCKECDHPLLWHGDRAVAACDGGWNRIQVYQRQAKPTDQGRSICACSGWKG